MSESATQKPVIPTPDHKFCPDGQFISGPNRKGELRCDSSPAAQKELPANGVLLTFEYDHTLWAYEVTRKDLAKAIPIQLIANDPKPSTFIHMDMNLDARQPHIQGPSYTLSLASPYNHLNTNVGATQVLVPDGMLHPGAEFVIQTHAGNYSIAYGGIASTNNIADGIFGQTNPQLNFATYTGIKAEHSLTISTENHGSYTYKFGGTQKNLQNGMFLSLDDLAQMWAKAFNMRGENGKIYLTLDDGNAGMNFTDSAGAVIGRTLGLKNIPPVEESGPMRFSTMNGLQRALESIPGVSVLKESASKWMIQLQDYRDTLQYYTRFFYDSVTFAEHDAIVSNPALPNRPLLGATDATTIFKDATDGQEFSIRLAGNHTFDIMHFNVSYGGPENFNSISRLSNIIHEHKDKYLSHVKDGALVIQPKQTGVAIEVVDGTFGAIKNLGLHPSFSIYGASTVDGQFVWAENGYRFAAETKNGYRFTTDTEDKKAYFVYINKSLDALTDEDELFQWVGDNDGKYYTFTSLRTLADAMNQSGFLYAVIKDNALHVKPLHGNSLSFADEEGHGKFVEALGLASPYGDIMRMAVNGDRFTVSDGKTILHFVYLPKQASELGDKVLQEKLEKDKTYYSFKTPFDLIHVMNASQLMQAHSGHKNKIIVKSDHPLIFKDEKGSLVRKMGLGQNQAETLEEYFDLTPSSNWMLYDPKGQNSLTNLVRESNTRPFYTEAEIAAGAAKNVPIKEPVFWNIWDSQGFHYSTYMAFLKLQPNVWAIEYIAGNPKDFLNAQKQLAAVTVHFNGNGSLRKVEGDAELVDGRYVTKMDLLPKSHADPIHLSIFWGSAGRSDGLHQVAAPHDVSIDVDGSSSTIIGFTPIHGRSNFGSIIHDGIDFASVEMEGQLLPGGE